MSTLMERFFQNNDKSKTILTTLTGNYTVSDLEKQTATYLELLQKQNIAGKRIGILVPNVFSYLSLTLAINQLDGIVVPLSWQYRKDDLKEILRFLDPHIVFTITTHGGFSFVKEIEQWAKESEDHTIIYQSEDGFRWEEFGFGKKQKALEESSIDFIYCTSGSTGLPKALMLQMNTIEFSTQYSKELFDLKRSDRVFTMTPPTSVLGIVYLLAGLREGLKIVFPDTFDLPLIVKLLRETYTNKILTTPSIMRVIYSFAKQLAPEVIENLELCVLAGEPVTAEISGQVHLNDNCKFLINYGSSEMGSCLYCVLENKVEFSTFRGVEYRISPDGELLLHSPGSFIGYYKQPELTSQMWTSDGLFHTGDLVKVNENSKLEIIGRKKDLIKKGGQQVIPGEVEKILLQHPNVKQAVVLGAPHSIYGEQVVAFVVLQENSSVKELYTFCAERIARYKVPDSIEEVSEIPIAQGKVDKITLRKIFLSKNG